MGFSLVLSTFDVHEEKVKRGFLVGRVI